MARAGYNGLVIDRERTSGLYAMYVGTFRTIRAAMRGSDARRIEQIVLDVAQRAGAEGLASLVALSDASRGQPRRSPEHLLRVIAQGRPTSDGM